MEEYNMDRNNIELKYQWDLSKIYESIDDFRMDIKMVRSKLSEFSKFEGIKYDENNLYEVIDLSMNVSRILGKLSVYASLLCDEDTSINKNQELKEEIILILKSCIRKIVSCFSMKDIL